MSRIRGFTLLEVLVAVALFAVAGALAYGGLSMLARSRGELERASEQLRARQLAIGLIERDIRALVQRPIRDEVGRPQPALKLRRGYVELSRIGHGNALAQRRAEIERVGYQVDDGQLIRLHWDVLDRSERSVPVRQPLLDGIERLDLVAIERGGRRRDAWPPPPGLLDTLPAAIELRLVLADGGDLVRLLELPDGLPPEAAP